MERENTTTAARVVHTIARSRKQLTAEETADTLRRIDAQLQQKLLNIVGSCQEKPEVIKGIQHALAELVAPASLHYFDRDSSGRLLAVDDGDLLQRLPLGADESLNRWAAATCESGSVKINGLPGAHSWTVVTAPVILTGRPPEVVGAVFRRGSISSQQVAGALQLGASHITLWHIIQEANHSAVESKNAAALLELLAKLDCSKDLSGACYALVNDVRDFLGCGRVAIGLTGHKRVDCRLAAISGLSDFDKQSQFSRAAEAVLNEAVLRGRMTILPLQQDHEQEGTLAHQSLLSMLEAASLVSSPLFNEQGEVVGAWILLGESDVAKSRETVCFVRASQKVIGSRLWMLRQAQTYTLLRPLRALLERCRRWKVMVGAGLIAILIAVMFIPIRYRIGCDCQLEPVSRRFVAAPYDGTLEKAVVRPGELVTSGQTLARMDARELRWELSGLKADYESEKKKRDAASARDEVAESQQSDLEMQRMKLNMQLLEHRLDNLEIKSPIDGIVITGDLRKTEGTPLKIGQTMFEIGPLDQMIVEVAVPEREILYVESGMKVEMRLDAAQSTIAKGTIKQIFPRSELRDSESVYVAEVYLDNADGSLRPGMKGSAKVISSQHPLGWNLFHRAWESLQMMIGC